MRYNFFRETLHLLFVFADRIGREKDSGDMHSADFTQRVDPFNDLIICADEVIETGRPL